MALPQHLLFITIMFSVIARSEPQLLSLSIPGSNRTSRATPFPSSNQTSISRPLTTTTSSSSPLPFLVPSSTLKLSTTLSAVTVLNPTSSSSGTAAGGYVVVNPSNTQQSVVFAVATVPPDQRSNLPSATDAAPAALLLLGFALPGLLFGGFQMVIPAVDAATAATIAAAGWLSLSLYPTVQEAESSNPSQTKSKLTTRTSSSSSRSSSRSSSSSSSSSASGSIQTILETT